MAITPSKDQISKTVEELTPRTTGVTLFVNKQKEMLLYPVLVGDNFDDFVAETTEVFTKTADPKPSTKAAFYALVLEADAPDALPDGWQTKIMPLPLSRKWVNTLLTVIASEECPIACVTDGKLDADGTVFKMIKTGTGTGTSYSWMPSRKKFTLDPATVELPEYRLEEWAKLYGNANLKRAGFGYMVDDDDTGSEEFTP